MEELAVAEENMNNAKNGGRKTVKNWRFHLQRRGYKSLDAARSWRISNFDIVDHVHKSQTKE